MVVGVNYVRRDLVPLPAVADGIDRTCDVTSGCP